MVASIPIFNLLLIVVWIQFAFVIVIPKYLNFARFLKDLLTTFIVSVSQRPDWFQLLISLNIVVK
jgi:hypothetical protein